MSYKTARRDFEYLETLEELHDQVDLDSQREELMRNPTKKLAAEMYEEAIGLWFGEHRPLHTSVDLKEEPELRRIFNRYHL